ncbi:MAG: DUF4038 domain-containing protein [Candidatus Hydrogenedentota bacterium]
MHTTSRFAYAPRLCLAAVLGVMGSIAGAEVSELHTWEVYEAEWTAEGSYDNPYVEVPPDAGQDLVTAEFVGVSGEAEGETLEAVGFWDGGDTWRVRFAPPLPGRWEYRTQSDDPGLDGQEGVLDVSAWDEAGKAENPVRRGFIQVNSEGERAGRHFVRADGTPFLWVGDTWWNWTKRAIEFSTFQELVDDRADKGFTLGQLFVAANGWSPQSSLLNEDFTELDIDLMRRVDEMIAYANSRGLTVWVHGWWTRENMVENIGAENIRRWWRYLVHRLGAHNVIWVIAGEYNMHDYGGFDVSFWKDVGQLISDEDPYDRIISAHPTPPAWGGGADAPQWSTGEVLHDEPWLDYNQSQTGHARWRQEMSARIIRAGYDREPAKPTVITEPWYEFVEGNPSGREVRLGPWTAMLSGAAGHTYGGGHVWLAHVPESPGGGGPWPIEEDPGVNTLDYDGAVSMGHFASFFEEVEWWNMEPRPDLMKEYPEPYCLALPGEEYVLYLRWGGSAMVDLRDAGEDAGLAYRWFNPATGEYRPEQRIAGGAVRRISAPEDYPGRTEFRDWVLHIKRAE